MDVIIVCHTEFGFVYDKNIIFEKQALDGVRKGVSNLMKLADKYKAKITFAVCPEVVDFLPKNINQEIGLHIHPGWEEFNYKKFKWTVGDSYLKKKFIGKKNSTALTDYSYDEQVEMINIGKEYLKDKLGVDSKVFLGGRWSFNNDTAKTLVKLGFTHDCSAYPGKRLSYFDWSKLPRICMPYHPDSEDYQKKGNSPLLMVPVSKMFLAGAVCPEDARRCGLPWLKACAMEYYNQKAPLFHIALHSPAMTNDYYISVMEKLLSLISIWPDIRFRFVSEIKEFPEKEIKAKIRYYITAVNKEILKSGFKKIFYLKCIHILDL